MLLLVLNDERRDRRERRVLQSEDRRWTDHRRADLAADPAGIHNHDEAAVHGMRTGDTPDGAPPLAKGFLGSDSAAQAREHWRRTMQAAYNRFRESLTLAERFGGEPPWLDDYAAKDPAEFFAVTCEAYFVNRERFARSGLNDLGP